MPEANNNKFQHRDARHESLQAEMNKYRHYDLCVARSKSFFTPSNSCEVCR